MDTGRKISLSTHEERIRRWVSEGKDDAWIAGALGTSAGSVQTFRSMRRILKPRGRRGPSPDGGFSGTAYGGALERAGDGGVVVRFAPAMADDALHGERWKGRGRVRVAVSPASIVVFPRDVWARKSGGG